MWVLWKLQYWDISLSITNYVSWDRNMFLSGNVLHLCLDIFHLLLQRTLPSPLPCSLLQKAGSVTTARIPSSRLPTGFSEQKVEKKIKSDSLSLCKSASNWFCPLIKGYFSQGGLVYTSEFQESFPLLIPLSFRVATTSLELAPGCILPQGPPTPVVPNPCCLLESLEVLSNISLWALPKTN